MQVQDILPSQDFGAKNKFGIHTNPSFYHETTHVTSFIRMLLQALGSHFATIVFISCNCENSHVLRLKRDYPYKLYILYTLTSVYI